MIRVLRWTFLLAAGLAGCGRVAPRDLRSDTYAVYAAVLDSFPLAQGEVLRVSSQTWHYSLSRAVGNTSAFYRDVQADSGVGPTLLATFDSANVSRGSLCDCFPPAMGVRLVPDSIRPDMPGPFALSKVAFSPDGARALAAVGHSCGPLCGGWALYLIVREPRGWRVARRVISGTS